MQMGPLLVKSAGNYVKVLPQRAIRMALHMHVNKIPIDPAASIAIPHWLWLHTVCAARWAKNNTLHLIDFFMRAGFPSSEVQCFAMLQVCVYSLMCCSSLCSAHMSFWAHVHVCTAQVNLVFKLKRWLSFCLIMIRQKCSPYTSCTTIHCKKMYVEKYDSAKQILAEAPTWVQIQRTLTDKFKSDRGFMLPVWDTKRFYSLPQRLTFILLGFRSFIFHRMLSESRRIRSGGLAVDRTKLVCLPAGKTTSYTLYSFHIIT